MTGPRLRARREALGRSLEDLSRSTRIPVAHLEALEDDRLEDLPAGPYAAAYVRTLRSELGLDGETESDDAPARATPPQGAPLWLVRALAVTSLFALFVVLASYTWERVRPELEVRHVPSAARDQTLVIQARRTTRVTVVADGETKHDADLAGGERLEFDARDGFEVDVAMLSALSLQWNGEDLVPQGVQDAPRHLVFVDDEGGAAWPEP